MSPDKPSISSNTLQGFVPPESQLLSLMRANWQAEIEDYTTYSALAAKELNPKRRNALRGLAAAESHHADLWATRIQSLGSPPCVYSGPLTGHASEFTESAGGVDFTLRSLKIKERNDIERYQEQSSLLEDAPTLAVLGEIIADENEHYKVLSNLIRSRPPIPDLTSNEASRALEVLLAVRRRNDPQAASWFSDALYAANDGLGSIFCVVSGVAGATLGNSHFILLAGFAGMVGSSLSTGTSAYLASKSEREVFQAGFERERTAVEQNEAEAREVLTLSYQSRGLPADVASRLVHLLAEDKQHLIKALARARLNMTEEDLSVPWVSVISGTLATALGAFVPIIPFFFMAGVPALITATIISLAAHFAAGAARSIMTIRPWWSTGLELTAIGAIEGAITFGIGMALGYFVGAR